MMRVKLDHLGDVSLLKSGKTENDWLQGIQMTFRSNVKKSVARFLVNSLRRKPDRVARFLNISRATIYRYIK